MPKYSVPVYWTEGGTVIVEAENPERAAQKARCGTFTKEEIIDRDSIAETWEVVEDGIELYEL